MSVATPSPNPRFMDYPTAKFEIKTMQGYLAENFAIIHPELGVLSHNLIIPGNTLGDQHSIKWIPVMKRQFLQGQCIVGAEIKQFKTTLPGHLLRVKIHLEFADR